MSISSNAGVSQFMIRAFQVERQTAIRYLEIAFIRGPVKADPFPNPLTYATDSAENRKLGRRELVDPNQGGRGTQPPLLERVNLR